MCVVDTEMCWGHETRPSQREGSQTLLTKGSIICFVTIFSLRKNTLNCDSTQSWGSFLLCESVGLSHP